MRVQPLCETCRHWQALNDGSENGKLFGQCRRNAPSPTLGGVSLAAVTRRMLLDSAARRMDDFSAAWPLTRATDYCGQWELER